jgi:hypothetical protein
VAAKNSSSLPPYLYLNQAVHWLAFGEVVINPLQLELYCQQRVLESSEDEVAKQLERAKLTLIKALMDGVIAASGYDCENLYSNEEEEEDYDPHTAYEKLRQHFETLPCYSIPADMFLPEYINIDSSTVCCSVSDMIFRPPLNKGAFEDAKASWQVIPAAA